jgi:hypothetical protein
MESSLPIQDNSIHNDSRCVTPSSLILTNDENEIPFNDNNHDYNDYDIPHMLNPYSGQSDNEDDNYCHDDEVVVVDDDQCVNIIKVSPTDAQAMINNTSSDSPQQYWHVSTGPYDVVNTSPVSSISNFSFDHIHAFGFGDSRDEIVGVGVNVADGGNRREFMSFLNNNHSHKQKVEEFPTSPNLVHERHVPRTTLKPRYGTLDHNGNQNHNLLSSNDATPVTKIGRVPSPAFETDSQGSNNSSHRSRGNRYGITRSYNGSDLPPSPPNRRKTKIHRRSLSLNQVPSSNVQYNGHRKNLNRFEEQRLSPLREEIHSSNSKQNHKLPTSSYLSHRRTVSFPDQVLQKGVNTGFYGINRNLTSQSDDPALFSLVETTQSRNGRVCIPFDVDPAISKNISLPTMQNVNNQNLYITSDQLMQSSKKMDKRYHRSRKHRKGTGSASGSFSSLELKLASLEEENLEGDDSGEQIHVNRSQSQHLTNGRRTQIMNTSAPAQQKQLHPNQHFHYTSTQAVNTNDGSKRSNKKRKDIKKREKKNRKNNRKMIETSHLYDAKETFDTEEGMLSSNGSPNNRDLNRKGRKNKEACVIM